MPYHGSFSREHNRFIVIRLDHGRKVLATGGDVAHDSDEGVPRRRDIQPSESEYKSAEP